MNIIIYTLFLFATIYILLKILANISSKKISRQLRKIIFISSIVLAILIGFWGKIFVKFTINFTQPSNSQIKRIFNISINRFIQT